MRMLLVAFVALTGTIAIAGDDTGITVKTRTTFTDDLGKTLKVGRTHTTLFYIRPDRQRWEEHWEALGPAPASAQATIYRCDQKRMILLNTNAQTYNVTPDCFEDEAKRLQKWREAVKAGKIKSKPIEPGENVMTITLNRRDTGERREINGITLRHLTETRTHEYSAGAPKYAALSVERDGWYAADIPRPGTCGESAENQVATFSLISAGQPLRTEVKVTGEKNLRFGYPVIETVTTTNADGTRWVTTTELLELSRAPLDNSLFEIPSGFRQAQRYPRGGVDMERPETLWGSLRAWWESLWR